ncbi:LysR family transcriptional regulator [Xylophilus sp. Kf1]|nr:LysR family transcriptional regulator [Xylophilus sp. Kf1]
MKRSLHSGLPSLDTLLVFQSAAAHLSFTRAGRQVGLTQSAVSRQMLDLEQLLQVTLFSRERRALSLTAAGEEFRELIQPAMQSLQGAVLRMRLRNTQTQAVNISIAASFCNLWFIQNLPRFYASQHGVRVNIVPHVGDVVFQSADLHAAIVNADAPPRGCRSLRLIDIAVAPHASAALLAESRIQRLDQFVKIPALELRERAGTWPRYLAAANLAHLQVDYVGSNSLLLLNYEAAIAGLGVALLPPEFLVPGTDNGGLVCLHDQVVPTGRHYYYCWPESGDASAAVHSLGEWVLQEINAARARRSRLPATGFVVPLAQA